MTIKKQVKELVTNLRERNPLVHNITNYVTVNDCANAILAIGASPVMADDIKEAESITSISSAVVINIGTLNERTVASMLASGKKANELSIPVIFDPVGAGASKFRNDTAREILKQVKVNIIRGNLSEVSFIAGLSASTKGVDVSEEDFGNDAVTIAKLVAEKYNCVVAVTGAIDIISDGKKLIKISNGHKMLSKVTGTGCMSSALVASFAGLGDDYLTAAAAGVVSMGIAGEIAYEDSKEKGLGSFHIAIIDALGKISGELVEEMARIDEE